MSEGYIVTGLSLIVAWICGYGILRYLEGSYDWQKKNDMRRHRGDD